MANMPSKTINDLPDEVLQQMLYYLPPCDVLRSIQFLSKRFARLADHPLLWRYHCRTQFRYWDSKHRITQNFSGSVGDVDWKALYAHRHNVDTETTRKLDSILEGQVGRILKFESIKAFGFDAKDTLLRHCRSTHENDILARRFYANAALDHVHRSKALAEWSKLGNGEAIPIERALGSFDLFVLHDQHGDLLEISELFDDLVQRLRLEYPNFDELSTRKRALSVVTFLRAHTIVGLADEEAYRDLQNNYIGIALQDQEHPSLPLISAAIFCALATRFGLDARCCGLPGHVHAIVLLNPSEDHDGLHQDEALDCMYLDPYGSDSEVPVQSLRRMLAAWGIPPGQRHEYLADAPVQELVVRTSRNIIQTVQHFRTSHAGQNATGHPTIRLHANPFADLDNALYSALWANFMFSDRILRADANPQRHIVHLLRDRFATLYPMDASLIEQYICNSFTNTASAELLELYEVLRTVRRVDSIPQNVQLRKDHEGQDTVKYRVGQVFRHKRYDYSAVIIGWDVECHAGTEWIIHNNVDSLSKGRHQSFYHALVDDCTTRYVAEENVEIVEPDVPISLMSLAGRYFKRWDKEHHVFVSNIRDEYPDD